MRQWAIVTGGAKRLGKIISEHLINTDYNILIIYNKSKKEALEFTQSYNKNDKRCLLLQSDLSKEKSTLKIINFIKKQNINVKVLINNASVFQRNNIENTKYKLYKNTMNTNLTAPFFLISSLVNFLKNGQIINITDTKIMTNKSQYAAYTLSKKSLDELTRMAALEFAPMIRVNSIALGYILPNDHNKYEDFDNQILKIPLEKNVDTKNFTKTIDFLLDNNDITGQTIFLDGGMHLL